MKYADAVKKFDPVIGLETHVELSTTTKLFCPAEVHFGGEPNTQLTPVSLGLPGSLPVVNKTAVDYAIKLGLALHCEIAEWSQFARKNYFYPDMPRDYQISQYDKPTNGNGYLDVELEDGTIFRVPIERAHIEDDAGKNTHVGGADGRIEGADHSLVDYNRAGVPLIEIVTKPIEGAGDRAPEIAGAYMRAIRDIVRALNISHARMEQGNMRADVNVSLRNSPSDPFGTRSETKNVNSFRGIEKTIQYEIRRQAAILSEGGEILQETRHWDEASQTTAGGRVKSDADDYRYFPDPDLVMLHITKEHIEEMKAQMPEMPRERRNRLKSEWGLSDLQMRDILNADALDLIEEPSRPVPRLPVPASGGWASFPAKPTPRVCPSKSCRSPRPMWPRSRSSSPPASSTTSSPSRPSKACLRAKALRTKSSRSTTTRSSKTTVPSRRPSTRRSKPTRTLSRSSRAAT